MVAGLYSLIGVEAQARIRFDPRLLYEAPKPFIFHALMGPPVGVSLLTQITNEKKKIH